MRAPDLHAIVAKLREIYGELRPRITKPFEMILLENASYLVDDPTRHETLERLRDEIGLTPDEILRHSADDIARVVERGGMKPLHRAEKVLESARIAREAGGDLLEKKLLQRFPSIGEPYADRVLLFNGKSSSVAPDSNALRVLCRLGFAPEDEKHYTKTYRTAVAAAGEQVQDAATAREAHLLLRRHGQEVCKRSAPRCEACPLRRSCAWYAKRA
jgi:endonuclease III